MVVKIGEFRFVGISMRFFLETKCGEISRQSLTVINVVYINELMNKMKGMKKNIKG